nr:MAG TPA: hypothetical protein [Caudoviricetes sp.]DAX16674.1 MAG TPA: hypothetical protein [Caudoviricetes sp.]DAX37442.1 MAG TPA: hypothetical protein [Caudoviricetes sp.]
MLCSLKDALPPQNTPFRTPQNTCKLLIIKYRKLFKSA